MITEDFFGDLLYVKVNLKYDIYESFESTGEIPLYIKQTLEKVYKIIECRIKIDISKNEIENLHKNI